MNGNDTYLDVNNAHLRVTSGNVHASGFNLDQISIVTTSNTGSTINFLNDTKGFMSRSNIEVGTANLFVDTTTSRVGIGTDAPAYTLDVHGSANVGVITTTDINVTGNLAVLGTTTTVDTDNLRVKDPIIELGKGNAASPVVDLGLILTRPTGSSNVAIIYDESTDNLEIGYTQGNASQSIITMETAAANPISVNVNGTISGNGSGLTALPAAQITGTLDAARIPALDTAKITTGTLDAARIPALDTAKITTGTLDAARIPALDTAKITTGTLDAARIPTLNQNTTGSAGSATTAGTAATLTTARSIGGVSFDGSEAIVPTTFNGATFNGDVGIGTTTPQQKLEVHGNILLGQNNIQSFIHCGADMALSADTDIMIVSDANLTTGDPGGDIIFGAGSAINMDTNRDFTFAQAYPSSVPRLEHVRILGSNGNVGIGMIDPGAKLDVNGSIRGAYDTDTTSYFGRSAVGYVGHSDWAGLAHIDRNNGSDYALLQNSAGRTIINSKSDQRISFSSGDNETMCVKGSDVGIGTNSPDTILHVEAASNPQILVEDTGSANQCTIRFKTATTDWTVGQHGGETGKFKIANHTVLGTNDHITIDTSGNVGIGMIDPGAKLDVNGIVKATNLDLDGNVVRSAANITLTANSWAKIADFAGLVTGGHYLISIKWDNSALVGGGTAIWYGGMTYSTYVIGTASVYNTTGDELIKYNAHYHYRTISAFEFVQDSDSSSGNYGQHSIYMKSPQSAIVASGVSVTAYRIG
jgi:hypothetical protein